MAWEGEVRVTFRDVDAMQHVNNAVYFTWMETARTEYYLGLRKSREMSDVDIIIARQTCDYKRGARLGETVRVRVWPSRLGKRSFDLSYSMHVGDEPIAYGVTVVVSYDYGKNAAKEIPQDMRKAMERDLGDPVIEA